MVHAGSWSGLPDFGVTEGIANLFGQARNSQGGSQLRQGTVFNVGNVPYQSGGAVSGSNMSYTPGAGGGYYSYSQPSNNGGGDVLGANTGGGGGGGNTGPTNDPNGPQSGWGREFPNMDAYNKFRDETTSAINSTYSNIQNRLDSMAGLLPSQQAEDIGILGESAAAVKSGLQTAKQGELDKIGTYRTDVEARKASGIGEVQQNLRNLLKATGMKLGAMGAGSSSASDIIMPYALGKQGARATGQIVKGANDQMSELDRKAVDVNTTFETQMSETDRWEAEQKGNIISQYRQTKAAIDNAKNTADENKMQALVAMETNIFNNVQSYINNIETMAMQYRQSVQDWARSRVAQLQDYKLQLSQSGNFSPQELTYQALQGMSGYNQGQGDAFYNPYAITAKKREDLFS